MKELSIEEKARRYDEAIKVAKRNYDTIVQMDEDCTFAKEGIVNTFHHIFPELQESKDERIKKGIIATLHLYFGEPLDDEAKEMIAWVKKQEQTFTKKDIDNAYLKGICDAKQELEKQNENTYNKELSELLHKVICRFINDPNIPYSDREKVSMKVLPYVEQLEKQVGQPTDKVEPKFHKGEWVAINSELRFASPLYIRDIDNNNYRVESVDGNSGTPTIDYLDSHYHLWTISDAKDGDVLVCKGNLKYSNEIKFDRICLFNTLDNAFFTVSKYSNGIEDYDINVNIDYPDNIMPATKEQKEILFMVMKEAGYEWDAEKKELEKIKRKLTELAKGEDYGIDSLWHAQRILEKTFGEVEGYQSDDGILEHECAISAVKELYKQKHNTWSEEDEKNIERIIDTILCVKSINNGIPKALYTDEILDELVDWLKFLKDRVQPQPKQELSEEDKKLIDDTCHLINTLASGYGEKVTEPITFSGTQMIASIKDRLRALVEPRPQNHWQPSDEQMDALRYVFQHYLPTPTDTLAWDALKTIELMLDQLKELREE